LNVPLIDRRARLAADRQEDRFYGCASALVGYAPVRTEIGGPV
jgi:hypothetical protein